MNGLEILIGGLTLTILVLATGLAIQARQLSQLRKGK